MDFYKRYLSGENKTVYDEISEFGRKAFLPENFEEIEAVLNETFNRVAVNLEIIYNELQNINYLFKTEFTYTSDKPLIEPLTNTDVLLKQLDKAVEPFGFVPLSLKKFYQIVGACNFVWDYDVNEDRFWDYSDPLQISSLDDLLNYTASKDWEETMAHTLEESETPYLELAADFNHKDNTSGGMPYSLEITKNPSIDGLFLFEPHNTTYIDYLRICFEKCGFSQISKTEVENDYKSYFSRVKPQLLKI